MTATQADFDIGALPVRLHRSWWTGNAWLQVDGRRVPLESPFRFGTHFSFPWRLTKTWRCEIDGHSVEIMRHRKMLLSAGRKAHYSVNVDGQPNGEFEAY